MHKKTINFQRLHTIRNDVEANSQQIAFEKCLRVINSNNWEENLIKLKEINFDFKSSLIKSTKDQIYLMIKSILIKDNDCIKKLFLLDSLGIDLSDFDNIQKYELINACFHVGKNFKCDQNSVYEKLSFLQNKSIKFNNLEKEKQHEILLKNLTHRIDKVIKFLHIKEDLDIKEFIICINNDFKFWLIRDNFSHSDIHEFLKGLNSIGLLINDLTSQQKCELIKKSLTTENYKEATKLLCDMSIDFENIEDDDKNDVIKFISNRKNYKEIIVLLKEINFYKSKSIIPTNLMKMLSVKK
jgi:hypothetical protein